MTPETNNFYMLYLDMHANTLIRQFLKGYSELKVLGYLNCYHSNNLKVGSFLFREIKAL